MTRRTAMERGYFDALYATDPDPWRFAESPYEREKYAATLAMLPDRRFAAGLEVGCSIGILTAQFAARCDTLLAIDVADAALARARAHCPAPHVRFANLRIPDEWQPAAQPFDLIVLSEVLYYLRRAELALAAQQMRAALAPDGVALLVHYLGLTDYPLSGDDATAIFMAESGLVATAQARAAEYRIDLLAPPPG